MEENGQRWLGEMIRRERLRRDWSQQGLCRGVCAVSYLSKIEKGKASPSPEICRLLLKRLGAEPEPAAEKEAESLAEKGYELLFTGRMREYGELATEENARRFRFTPRGLDFLLFCAEKPLETALEVCMEPRQLALQRMLEKRFPEAQALLPNAYSCFRGGEAAYEEGRYTAAIELLQTGYDLAARDGAPHLMLLCRTLIGNCYCNQQDFESMRRHYIPAMRLAEALGDREIARSIRYNTAAVQIEMGLYEDAYGILSSLPEPDVLTLHKLAVCCEKTGRKEEALRALEQADRTEPNHPEPALIRKLCALVRYRLEHTRLSFRGGIRRASDGML